MSATGLAAQEKLVERLRRMARGVLSRWGIDDISSLSLLKLRENAVFAVDSPGHERCVLRLHRPGYHSDQALQSELHWMTSLAEQGFPVPRILKTRDGQLFARAVEDESNVEYQCDLIKWIAGTPLGISEEGLELEQEQVDRVYRALGRIAAELHSFNESWSRPEDFVRHSWDERGCIGPQALWGDFASLGSLQPAERAHLQRAADIAKQRLEQFGKSAARYGLIHGDLVPDNVLREGERLTVIDFDDAGFGWYLWEIVTAVFFLQGTPAYEPALRAMIAGYREVRPLPDADLDILPTMLLVRGLVYLGWFHTRRETETARQMCEPVSQLTLELASSLLV